MPTFQQATASKPGKLEDFGGDLTAAADDVKAARRAYTKQIDNFRGTADSSSGRMWKGDDAEALARQVDRLALTANTNRVMTEAAGNALKVLGTTMKATAEGLDQGKDMAEKAGFKVLDVPFVVPGPRHYQQAANAGYGAPAVIAAYWSIAGVYTSALISGLVALNGQDAGASAQLQGFAMSLGTTDVLPLDTSIGAYQAGPLPSNPSDLARTAVDSYCQQQDLPRSEFDPRTTAAMVDPNGNITYGPSVRHERINDPAVQEALDRVPLDEQSRSHGYCAEIGALNAAQPSRNDVRGSVIATMKNRGANSNDYRSAHPPCGTCAHVLNQFGVTYAD
ncbi:hypothetical protein [Glycomyces sp. NPDC048151]|uniref:hypothetical protein n=1 Tax=Glycomyces sp. NPDC048151 TaxID=3364002 RepID=UPI003723737B